MYRISILEMIDCVFRQLDFEWSRAKSKFVLFQDEEQLEMYLVKVQIIDYFHRIYSNFEN